MEGSSSEFRRTYCSQRLQLVFSFNSRCSRSRYVPFTCHVQRLKNSQNLLGAFSYDFGALGDNPSEYQKAHMALLYVSPPFRCNDLFTSCPTLCSSAAQKKPGGEKKFGWSLAGLELLDFIPSWILGPVCKLIFMNPLIKNFRNSARNIASEIIQKEKDAAAAQIPEGKDIMSIMGETLLPFMLLTDRLNIKN